MTEEKYFTVLQINQRSPVGRLFLVPGTTDVVVTITKMPSRWHQFWHKVLLGFTYQRGL